MLLLNFSIYDDVAAFWFATCLLGIIVVPQLFLMAWRFIYDKLFSKVVPSSSPSHDPIARVSPELAKVLTKADVAEDTPEPKWTWKGLAFWTATGVFLYLVLVQVPSMQSESMSTFDPFAVLNVDESVTKSQLRKAYRKLSLVYHPDKNPGDPQAQQRFILIAKAYETLTDPVSRANYERYGNPDGFQGASNSIGLPSWLMDRTNSKIVLAVYFVLFLLVLPISLKMWWDRAVTYNEQGIHHATTQRMMHVLDPGSDCRNLLDALSQAQEMLELTKSPLPREAEERLQKLHTKLKGYDEYQEPKHMRPAQRRALVLLYAHYLNIELKNPVLEENQKQLLGRVHKLLDAAIDVCVTYKYRAQSLNMLLEARRAALKQLGDTRALENLISKRQEHQAIKPIFEAVDLCALTVQRMWVDESPLLQLPYFTKKQVKLCHSFKARTVAAFARLSKSRQAKVLKTLTPEQRRRVLEVVSLFPILDVHCDYYVPSNKEPVVHLGDTLTFALRVKRNEPAKIIELDDDDEAADEAHEAQNGKQQKQQKKQKKQRKRKKSRSRKSSSKPDEENDESGDDNDDDGDDDNDGEDSEDDAEAKTEPATEEEDEQDGENEFDDAMDLHWEGFRPGSEERKKRGLQSPLVYAPHFPFPKREHWYVFVKDQARELIFHIERVKVITQDESTIKFQVMLKESSGFSPGVCNWKLVLKSDSYFGCELEVPLKFTLLDEAEEEESAALEDDDDDTDDDTEDGDEEVTWLMFIGDIVGAVVAVALIAVLVYNIAHSRGYGATVDAWISRWISPTWHMIRSALSYVFPSLADAGGASADAHEGVFDDPDL